MLSILFFLLVVTIILALFYGALLGTLWSEAPFVPTGRRDLKRMIEVAAIKPGEVVYDLGSGDGRIVRAAARLGARAVGYEKSLPLIWWSRFTFVISSAARNLTTRFSHGARSLDAARDDVRFIRADYLNEDLREAEVIFCYLMPKAMEHLKAKFEKELRPGTRIISRAFSIPGWQARQNLPATDKNLGGQAQVFRFSKRSPPVYLYVIP